MWYVHTVIDEYKSFSTGSCSHNLLTDRDIDNDSEWIVPSGTVHLNRNG